MNSAFPTSLPPIANDPLQSRDSFARRAERPDAEPAERFADHLDDRRPERSEPARNAREARDVRESVGQASREEPRALENDGAARPADTVERNEDAATTGARETVETATRDGESRQPAQGAEAAEDPSPTATPDADAGPDAAAGAAQAAGTETQILKNQGAAVQAASAAAAGAAAATPAKNQGAGKEPARIAAATGKPGAGEPATQTATTPAQGQAARAGEVTSVAMTPFAAAEDADLLPDLITVPNATAGKVAAQMTGARDAGAQVATAGAAKPAGDGAATARTASTGAPTGAAGTAGAGNDPFKAALPQLSMTLEAGGAQPQAQKALLAQSVSLPQAQTDPGLLSGGSDGSLTASAGQGATGKEALGKLTAPNASQPGLRMAAQNTPPTAQIALQLSRAAADGQNRMSIQLQPAELGRVDVRLEVAADGKVMTIVAAERAETLDLLQRDQRGLEKALQDAGMDPDADGFTFLLDQGEQDERQQFAGGDGETGGDAGFDGEGEAATPAAPIRIAADGTLDIRI